MGNLGCILGGMSEQGSLPEPRIGVDESGKGDYFGPLVIAACYAEAWHEEVVEGVMDSKKLSDKKALAISTKIKEHCPHAVITVGPERYNELYKKIGNLNRLLEWGHGKAIEEVLKQQDCDLVISDQFANPAGLQRVLGLKKLDVRLVSRVRAESDFAVAAASILARAAFLRGLERLGQDIGVPLPKGAGPQVDAVARKLVASQGREVLGKVAKLHFKTTQKVLGG